MARARYYISTMLCSYHSTYDVSPLVMLGRVLASPFPQTSDGQSDLLEGAGISE